MERYQRVPKMEMHSFYQYYKPQAVPLELDTIREKREFVETYIEYVWDGNGNCTMFPRASENAVM